IGLILLFLQRVDKKKYIYNLWDKIIVYLFNRKVAKYAIKNRVDAVIMYDTLGECTFKILKNKAPNINRILDMSAPNIEYMDYILKKEINSNNSKILSEELRAKVHALLESMPEKTRTAFIRDRLDGKSHKEIAEELGISVKGVEYHISRAVKILRDNLKDYAPFLFFFI
ncbi:MAG: sigma-70 family RNA polymerase sigma factor, partial [Bacteroides ovatus]|nr:sigma-70 family RNA polymerase sigma factor [Bacteroides ovatus]